MLWNTKPALYLYWTDLKVRNSESQNIYKRETMHVRILKKMVLIFFISLFINRTSGQTIFSFVDVKLETSQTSNSTDIVCSNDTFSVQFKLKKKPFQQLEGNFVYIESQIIQITPLEIGNYKKNLTSLTSPEQMELLQEYSKYELDYFKDELKFEIIKPTSQWVTVNSKVWLIWYFRIGNLPSDANTKMDTQLYASTIVGDKILTINAPMHSGSNFSKGALLVNEMMESFTIKN